ncbi:MAG: hypothetical protein WCV84_05045 [Patescibacteria group bacterium]
MREFDGALPYPGRIPRLGLVFALALAVIIFLMPYYEAWLEPYWWGWLACVGLYAVARQIRRVPENDPEWSYWFVKNNVVHPAEPGWYFFKNHRLFGLHDGLRFHHRYIASDDRCTGHVTYTLNFCFHGHEGTGRRPRARHARAFYTWYRERMPYTCGIRIEQMNYFFREVDHEAFVLSSLESYVTLMGTNWRLYPPQRSR